MKGDIFNYCCSNASGDFFNATEPADLVLPYSEEKLQYLRDQVSITLNNKAVAEAEQKQAELDYHNCQKRSRLVCNLRTRGDRLDLKNTALFAATKAYEAAVADLKQAEDANRLAQERYDKELAQYNTEQQHELDIIKANPQAAVTQQTSEKNMAFASSTGKKALYGVGILGVLVAAYLGFKHFKK